MPHPLPLPPADPPSPPQTPISSKPQTTLRSSAYDTKTFYKNFDSTKLPTRFHIGTVIAAPTDFYGGRLSRDERKQTITEQVMADAGIAAQRKKRYAKIQEDATRFQKVKRRKTDLPRDKRSHHRSVRP